MDRSSKEGVLIVGHGSQDEQANEAFFQLVGLVQRLISDVPVTGGCLDLASPSIEVSVAHLVESGVERISVMPLMLFSGKHVQHDIPLRVADATKPYGGVLARQLTHFGSHPKIIELSRSRYEEALVRYDPIDSRETVLVLVTHGSHDARATAEMLHFADLRQATHPDVQVFPCFSAMARPCLDETLDQVARLSVHRIVIQPHFLFSGRLVNRIRTKLSDRVKVARSTQEWVITEPLGPDRQVAEAVVDLVSRDFVM